MKLSVGIVGLPNVGKSTIFNALIQKISAEMANYPFCTIEPNVGVVNVPDERLFKIAEIEKPEKVTPATIEFVDIAGLIKGASKGEGLGNQFLSHIRQVSAIAHVVRCFEDENVVHVEGTIDPVRDAETIEIELILADLQTVERRINKIEKKAKSGDKPARKELEILEKAKKFLEEFVPLRKVKNNFSKEELDYLSKTLFLLTLKPLMFVANLGEKDIGNPEKNPYFQKLCEKAEEDKVPVVPLCGKIEAEIAGLPENERQEYLEMVGLKEPGLNLMIKEGYKLLDLITFFTAGPKEVRAWTVKRGTKAPQAAGEIHSDFERGFIAAEVVFWEDLIKAGSFSKAREKGLVRIEGKDYEVKDGDVMLFKFNV